jgi:hypothetical protein
MKKQKTSGVFGIDANKKSVFKDPVKKRKPKFAHGAELKNSVAR